MVCSLVPASATAAWASAQRPLPHGHGGVLAPPVRIAGLEDASPVRPLEFSRAWLGRAMQVRERRAELADQGRLDGMDLHELARQGAALTGTLRVPVLPVRYADVPEPFPTSVIEDRLFGPQRGDTLSYAAYWREVSHGLLNVEGAVTPWIQVSRRASHYLPRESHGWANFGRIDELFREVMAQADRLLDFGRFDNDGPDGIPNSGDDDGYVDFVVILLATRCDDWMAGSIWPHRGAMPPYRTRSPAAGGGRIKVTDYVVLPVVDRRSCGPAHIGVLAHETGHALGLPDLYDYDGAFQGIGAWGLMGTGSHSEPFSPAHLSGWSKEQLGWIRVDWVRPGRHELLVPPVVEQPRAYRYELPGRRGEYLLLENRQRRGSDSYLPGGGLLVWHVDPEQSELGIWNADGRRRGVRLMAAGTRLNPRAGEAASGADPFPGRTGRTHFELGDGPPFRLTDIRDERGTIRLTVSAGRESPALVASADTVWFTARPDGAPLTQSLTVTAEGGASAEWTPSTLTRWLTAQRRGDRLVLRADPTGLTPGQYTAVVALQPVGPATGASGWVRVRLSVPHAGAISVVARDVAWSWGLAVDQGDVFQASYGWDGLALRPRARLLHQRDGQRGARTVARLPGEALFAPAADGDGGAYALAHSEGRAQLYRLDRDGGVRPVTGDLGPAPAYGVARLPGGGVLIADWEGRIRSVAPDGTVRPWTELHANVYQIAIADDRTLYAAAHDGTVVRIDAAGRRLAFDTGFGAGRLVAVAASPDGGAYAAERGGLGRIVRLTPMGAWEPVTRVPGAHFYGLAMDGGFLYALDIANRQILRIATAPAERVALTAGPGGP